MSDAVTFVSMPRSKPKTSAEGKEQLSSSLARMASAAGAGRGIPITEVGFGQCRFVVDDRAFPALCCGEPTLGGSWCAQHRALVFVRVAVPNGRRPEQGKGTAPAAKQPDQNPASAGAIPAAAASPAPAKETKAPSAAKSAPAPGSRSAAPANQKPATVASPQKNMAQKERGAPASSAKQGGAALSKGGAAQGRLEPTQKKSSVRSSAGRNSDTGTARGSRTVAASVKRGAPERSGAAKKAGSMAQRTTKGSVASKKPAVKTSKKPAAKRPASAKKTAASRIPAKRPASSKKATVARKRGARKKAG